MFERQLKKPIPTSEVNHPNIKINGSTSIFDTNQYTDSNYIRELFKIDTTAQHYHIEEAPLIYTIKTTHGFSTILLVNNGKTNYICNRNHNSIYKTFYIASHISWWGFPLSKFYTFFSSSVHPLNIFSGMGNINHCHQRTLNGIKEQYIKYNPQFNIKEDEKICDIVIKENAKEPLKKYKNLRKQFIEEYKKMSLTEVKSCCKDLIERFNHIYHPKIPHGHDVLMYVDDKGRVVIRFYDNPKAIYRYEGLLDLGYQDFCKLVFPKHFKNYEDFDYQLRNNPYYLKCYVVYICCFLRGYRVDMKNMERVTLKD